MFGVLAGASMPAPSCYCSVVWQGCNEHSIARLLLQASLLFASHLLLRRASAQGCSGRSAWRLIQYRNSPRKQTVLLCSPPRRRAIAQGCSEYNITCLIDQKDSVRALRAVHGRFYLDALPIGIGLLGPGLIGGTLLKQIQEQVGRGAVGLCGGGGGRWRGGGIGRRGPRGEAGVGEAGEGVRAGGGGG
jgi:hypothetical protein